MWAGRIGLYKSSESLDGAELAWFAPLLLSGDELFLNLFRDCRSACYRPADGTLCLPADGILCFPADGIRDFPADGTLEIILPVSKSPGRVGTDLSLGRRLACEDR